MKNSIKMANGSQLRIYKFSNCYLNTLERKLIKIGQTVELTPTAFDILQYLVERQGEVVSKDEILDRVWGDSFVEEGNLAVYISKLRKALKTKKNETLIETVSGVGYRFVSRVHFIKEEEWEHFTSKQVDSLRAEQSLDSIAILPLSNENGDEEVEYLADGLTESLINSLSYVLDLMVIARNTIFKYKNKEIDVQKIGRELNVKTVLTGRIRVIRDNLLIGVELTEVDEGRQLWGTQLNQRFEDILDVQENITQSISENLKIHIDKFQNNNLKQSVTQNAESYKLYLKGRYLLNKGAIKTTKKALEYFQQSISLDPANAHSYIEIANCYRLFLAYEEISREEATKKIAAFLDKASKLNSLIPALYITKGDFNKYLEFNFKSAEKNYKKALQINPNLVEARYRYAKLLVYMGRFSEALLQIKEASKLDPVSTFNNKNIARTFYFMGQYENAVLKTREALDLEPNDYQALLILGVSLVELKNYDDAIRVLKKALETQYHYEVHSLLGFAYGRAGKTEEVKKIIRHFEKESKNNFISPLYWSNLYASLGNNKKFFEQIEKAYEMRIIDLVALKCSPITSEFRGDPRFSKTLEKIGLPLD